MEFLFSKALYMKLKYELKHPSNFQVKINLCGIPNLSDFWVRKSQICTHIWLHMEQIWKNLHFKVFISEKSRYPNTHMASMTFLWVIYSEYRESEIKDIKTILNMDLYWFRRRLETDLYRVLILIKSKIIFIIL